MELVLSEKNSTASALNKKGLQDYSAFDLGNYSYIGELFFDSTDDYKYLIIKYSGDIASIRLEFVDSGQLIWFSENQSGSFITIDGNPIPFYNPSTDDGKDKIAFIDLEKSGVNGSSFSHFHIHAGYGGGNTSTRACIFKSAFLTDKLPNMNDILKCDDLDFVSDLIRGKSIVYLRSKDYPSGVDISKMDVGKIYAPVDSETKSGSYSDDNPPVMRVTLGSNGTAMTISPLERGIYIPLSKWGQTSIAVMIITTTNVFIRNYSWAAYKQAIDTVEYKMLTNSDVLTKYNVNPYYPSLEFHPATKKYVDDKMSTTLTKTNTAAYTPTGEYNPATKKYVDDSSFFVEYRTNSKQTINPGLLYIHLTTNSVFKQVLNYNNGFYWMQFDSTRNVSTPVKIIVGDVDVTNRIVINGFIIGRFVYGGTVYTGINFVDFGNIIPNNLFITPITNMNIFKDETTGDYYQSYVDNGVLKTRLIT